MMDAALQDLRYAWRSLRQRPAFAVVALLTLALGIGANTAIFSVVDWVLLRPLPYAHPDRIVRVWGRFSGGEQAMVSAPDFHDYRGATKSFEHLAAAQPIAVNLSGGDSPERIAAARVSAEFFATFGVPPVTGRTLEPADAADPGAERAVVLSRQLARRRFGHESDAVGKTVALDTRVLTVVGVMPAGFSFPGEVEAWLPSTFRGEQMSLRRAHFLRVVGLLGADVTMMEAQTELAVIARRLEAAHPEANSGWSLRLEPIRESTVGNLRTPLWILLGAVGFVLLIACTNLANLQLARGVERQRTNAVRVALGAGRGRLIRQAAAEAVLLAAIGGMLGTVVAAWGVELLAILAPADLPQLGTVRMDARVLAFAATASVLTAMVSGILPALAAARPDLPVVLASEGRTATASAHRRGARGALVVAEIALALILLTGAGLLFKSFHRLVRVDPGFETEHALVGQINLPPGRYPDEESRARFFRRLFTALEASPGVVAAGGTTHLPLTGQDNDNFFSIEGRPWPDPNAQIGANLRGVSPSFFGALGMTLLRGRPFEPRDAGDSARVVIVNQAFARAWFPGESPIGRRLLIWLDQQAPYEIVGVVSDVRHFGLDADAPPEMYLPSYSMWGGGNVVLRTTGDPAALAELLRSQVRRLDPAPPVAGVRTMEQVLAESTAPARFQTTLLALFSALALALACIGLYGLVAGSVVERTREIGVRVAFGAQVGDVVGLILRRAALLCGLGVVLGVAGALLLSRFLESLLFGVEPTDPPIFAGVVLLLLAVALLASWWPARRAGRLDPLIALRSE